MNSQVVQGKLLGVVEGPAILLEVKGQEVKLSSNLDLSIQWIQKHVETEVMVMIENDQVTEIV